MSRPRGKVRRDERRRRRVERLAAVQRAATSHELLVLRRDPKVADYADPVLLAGLRLNERRAIIGLDPLPAPPIGRTTRWSSNWDYPAGHTLINSRGETYMAGIAGRSGLWSKGPHPLDCGHPTVQDGSIVWHKWSAP